VLRHSPPRGGARPPMPGRSTPSPSTQPSSPPPPLFVPHPGAERIERVQSASVQPSALKDTFGVPRLQYLRRRASRARKGDRPSFHTACAQRRRAPQPVPGATPTGAPRALAGGATCTLSRAVSQCRNAPCATLPRIDPDRPSRHVSHLPIVRTLPQSVRNRTSCTFSPSSGCRSRPSRLFLVARPYRHRFRSRM